MRRDCSRSVATAGLFWFALLVQLSVQPARSQAGLAVPPLSPQAFAAIIDRHYNQLRSLSVLFTQKYAGMGMYRQESGVLLLKRNGAMAGSLGKMRWTYTDPPGKLFIMDGHDAYFYTPGQTEIPRVPAKRLDDLRSPLAFLLGHARLATELDGLTFAEVGMASWTLKGVPRGMEKRIVALTITARADGTIDSMEVAETDGAINSFRFTDERPNVPIPPGAFTFAPPPGTHVIEGMPPL